MRVYEYVPQERDEALAFRNGIFNQINTTHWEAMDCTGVVAREGERIVGFIPLQFRQQSLNPRVAIPVVYENAVGVAEGLRGQGIGTQMIDGAARFMGDRVDALMVVRGGERSTGYRFYRKTGHSDLSYACRYVWPAERSLPLDLRGEPTARGQIALLDRERWLEIEPGLLALYQRHYGRFGGGRRRGAGYWREILGGHVYCELEWRLVVLRDGGGRLAGYLVAAQGLASPSEELYIYEVVGETEGDAERLLRYACGRGWHRHAERATGGEGLEAQTVVPMVSLANPVRPLLRRMGFVEEVSTPHIMVRVLRPDQIFHRLADGSDLLDTLSLTAWTPHRTVLVNDPPHPRYTVQLETKESMLARLCCCRLDLDAALEMEWVRWNGRDPGLRRGLCEVFAFADWVQWFTDYV